MLFLQNILQHIYFYVTRKNTDILLTNLTCLHKLLISWFNKTALISIFIKEYNLKK